MTSRSLLLVNKFMYSFKHTWIQVPVLQLAGFVSLGKMVLSLSICKMRRSQYLFWGDIWRFNKNKVKMQIPVCYMCKCCDVVSLLFLAYKVPGPGLYSGQGLGVRGWPAFWLSAAPTLSILDILGNQIGPFGRCPCWPFISSTFIKHLLHILHCALCWVYQMEQLQLLSSLNCNQVNGIKN